MAKLAEFVIPTALRRHLKAGSMQKLLAQIMKFGVVGVIATVIDFGIMNLLPIPALDGGRLVFLLIELVRGKPVDPEKEGMVHMAGMAVLMALMVLVLFNDIRNLM